MHKVKFEPIEHKYSIEGREYPSYSKIAHHFGLTPDYDRWGNDTARDFGSAAHEMLRLFDLDDLGEYDPQLEPWLNGYKRFIEAYQPKWELIETPLISKVWGFAGMPDRFGIIKKNAVVDFKAGSPETSHAIQTAAYGILIEENFKEKVKERYSLYLKPNDFRLIKHEGRSDRSVFLGLAQAYSWKKQHKLIKE